MKVGSLFTGVGGFDLGFERAGMTVAWQCEIDALCREVLARHWPGVPCYEDVKDVNATVPAVDVLCGGFPCQDLSVAGKRAGLAGERSGLFYEFARVIEQVRPGVVVIENVPGLLSASGGRDMATVVGTLGELGYGWAYRVLDAQYFGLAQRRQRVFIVGCAGGDTGRAASILFEPESVRRDSPPSRTAGQGVAGTLSASNGLGSGSGRGEAENLIPTTDLDNNGAYIVSSPLTGEGAAEGAWRGDGSDNLIIAPTLDTNPERHIGRGYTTDHLVLTVGSQMPVEYARLQGFPADWNDWLPDSPRYKQFGNAVAVPVAYWLASRISSIEEGNP